jgi:transcriptional regulator with XRE-family HTH domain
MVRESILENIAKIRKKKGFSQDYFASKIGMKQSGYALIEKGERGLQYELLLQIADVFEMDVINIITYPDEYVPEHIPQANTKVLVEFEVSNDEFIKMGLKEKIIQVLNK